MSAPALAPRNSTADRSYTCIRYLITPASAHTAVGQPRNYSMIGSRIASMLGSRKDVVEQNERAHPHGKGMRNRHLLTASPAHSLRGHVALQSRRNGPCGKSAPSCQKKKMPPPEPDMIGAGSAAGLLGTAAGCRPRRLVAAS